MIESDLARIADALDRISAILYSMSTNQPTTEKSTAVSEPATKKTRAARAKAKADDPVPEPEPTGSESALEPIPEPEPAVDLTADGMRSRMRSLAALAPGNRDRLIEAMGTFGASNFSKLDPTDYPALSRLLDTIEEDSKP